MATEKQFNGRIVLKSDLEENWLKATNFTPKTGELIIYLPDNTYDYPRLKVGDGSTNVSALPFCDDHLQTLINNLSATDVDALPISGGTLTGILYTGAGDPLFIGTNGKIGVIAKSNNTSVGGFEVVGSDNKWQASMTAYNGNTKKNNSIIVNENGVQYVNENGTKNAILHEGNYVNVAVPNTRTINGKALNDDISLSAADVKALPDTTHIPSSLSEMNQNDSYQTVTKAEKEKLASIEAGANKYIHPTNTAHEAGLYKVTVDKNGHVINATEVTKTDITGLGIPSSDTTYSKATADNLGLVKVGYTTTDKNYAVQLDSNDKMYVNVPWTDTNTDTTYSKATADTLGLVKIGYTTTNKNYAVQLDNNGKMYVNVPWTDNNTTYDQATSSALGLVKMYSSTGDSTDGTMTRQAITNALNNKEANGAAQSALEDAKKYADQKIADLVNGAPEDLNTLDELAAALNDNKDILSTYVTNDTFNTHTTSTTLHISSAERQNWNAAYNHSQANHAPADAQKNQNAFSNVIVGSTTISADGPTDTLTLIAGSNITLTGDANGDSVTIAAKDTTYSAASTSALGLVKVGGVKTNAVTVNVASTTEGKYYPVEMNTDNKLFVNVPWTDSSITYSAASNSDLGLVKVHSVKTNAVAVNTASTTEGKYYPVEMNKDNKLFVNVPWTDNDTTYSQATSTTSGLVKIGYSESGKNYAVKLDTNGKMYVNVPWTDTDTNTTYSAGTGLTLNNTTFSVTLNDNNSLGTIGTTAKLYAVGVDQNGKLCVNVPWTDSDTTYSQATSSNLGLVKIGYSESGKNYAVKLDSNGKMYVNVPWTDTDTNTTYSAGTGISLSGTTFSNSGVRSIATGGNNGTISVNTNGSTTEVAIKGLASAAFKDSSTFATASQGTKADNALPAANVSGTVSYHSKFTAANKLGNSLISDDGSCTTIHSRLVVEGNGGSFNEGIRILPASNKWSNIFFSADSSTSGTHDSGWLIGRRGAAGGDNGATGDFTIEPSSSDGKGLTIHTNGNATLYGNQLRLSSGAFSLQYSSQCVKFVFA